MIKEATEILQTELGEIEMGVLTEGYTLADAIREGSKVTNQTKRGFFAPTQMGACALGAAYIALQARGIINKEGNK